MTDMSRDPRVVEKFKRAKVTAPKTCSAFTGYAAGIYIAEGVEVIVIVPSREDMQKFFDTYKVTPGDARFACPVAMLQLRDVTRIPDDPAGA